MYKDTLEDLTRLADSHMKFIDFSLRALDNAVGNANLGSELLSQEQQTDLRRRALDNRYKQVTDYFDNQLTPTVGFIFNYVRGHEDEPDVRKVLDRYNLDAVRARMENARAQVMKEYGL